jgi:hypothetical protein
MVPQPDLRHGIRSGCCRRRAGEEEEACAGDGGKMPRMHTIAEANLEYEGRHSEGMVAKADKTD